MNDAFNIDNLCPVNWLHPVNRGLKAWYLTLPGLTGGSRWMDVTKMGTSGNHGILTGTPTWSGLTGRPGGLGSVYFNGTTDFITIPRIITAYPFTLSCWFRTAAAATTYTLISICDTNTSLVYWSLFFRNGSPNTVSFDTRNGAGPEIISAGVLQANVWYHVCAAAHSSTDKRLFINGKLEVTGTTDITPVGIDNNRIGVFVRTTTTLYHHGLMDSVRISNIPLSDAQVKEEYEESRQSCPNLLNWIASPVLLASAESPAVYLAPNYSYVIG